MSSKKGTSVTSRLFAPTKAQLARDELTKATYSPKKPAGTSRIRDSPIKPKNLIKTPTKTGGRGSPTASSSGASAVKRSPPRTSIASSRHTNTSTSTNTSISISSSRAKSRSPTSQSQQQPQPSAASASLRKQTISSDDVDRDVDYSGRSSTPPPRTSSIPGLISSPDRSGNDGLNTIASSAVESMSVMPRNNASSVGSASGSDGSLVFIYSLSGSAGHKLDDSNHSTLLLDSKMNEEMHSQNENEQPDEPAAVSTYVSAASAPDDDYLTGINIKNNPSSEQAQETFAKEEQAFANDQDFSSEDDDFPPPITSPVTSDPDEDSCVSALTFECFEYSNANANANANTNMNMNMEYIKNPNPTMPTVVKPGECTEPLQTIESMPETTMQTSRHLNEKYMNTNSSSSSALKKAPRKSDRMEVVHNKVLDLQKENLALKQTNLQLMMQTSLKKEKEKQDALNAKRLDTIFQKVDTVQSENARLRKVNKELVDKVQELVASQAKWDDEHVGPADVSVEEGVNLDIIILADKDNVPVPPTAGIKSELEKHPCRSEESTENGCPVCGNHASSDKEESMDPTSGDEKENGQNERRGSFIMSRSTNRSNRKSQELKQRITDLEQQRADILRQLNETKLQRTQDLEKIAGLDADKVQEKLLVESLERQVKEKNVSVLNLEAHINRMNKEMIALRQRHDMDTDELHNAYDELKAEASQLVEWLKKQLAEYQVKDRAEDIAEAKDDSDLESMTSSEKMNLLNEIEEERNQWIGGLAGGISRLDMMPLALNTDLELIIRGVESFGSGLTDPLSP